MNKTRKSQSAYLLIGEEGPVGYISILGAYNKWKTQPDFIYVPYTHLAGTKKHIENHLARTGYSWRDIREILSYVYFCTASPLLGDTLGFFCPDIRNKRLGCGWISKGVSWPGCLISDGHKTPEGSGLFEKDQNPSGVKENNQCLFSTHYRRKKSPFLSSIRCWRKARVAKMKSDLEKEMEAATTEESLFVELCSIKRVIGKKKHSEKQKKVTDAQSAEESYQNYDNEVETPQSLYSSVLRRKCARPHYKWTQSIIKSVSDPKNAVESKESGKRRIADQTNKNNSLFRRIRRFGHIVRYF